MIETVLAVPKAFIPNSLLDSKLSDSLFKINAFIRDGISINVKKYQKMTKMGYQSKIIKNDPKIIRPQIDQFNQNNCRIISDVKEENINNNLKIINYGRDYRNDISVQEDYWTDWKHEVLHAQWKTVRARVQTTGTHNKSD